MLERCLVILWSLCANWVYAFIGINTVPVLLLPLLSLASVVVEVEVVVSRTVIVVIAVIFLYYNEQEY